MPPVSCAFPAPGGVCSCPGFSARFQTELRPLVPDTCDLGVFAPQVGAWPAADEGDLLPFLTWILVCLPLVSLPVSRPTAERPVTVSPRPLCRTPP